MIGKLQDALIYLQEIKNNVRKVINPETKKIADNGLKANLDYLRKTIKNADILKTLLLSIKGADFSSIIKLLDLLLGNINALIDNNCMDFSKSAWLNRPVSNEIPGIVSEIDIKLNKAYIEMARKKMNRLEEHKKGSFPYGIRKSSELDSTELI